MHILHCICNVCHVVPNQQLSLFLFERARFLLLLQASDITLEWLVCFCPAAESVGIPSGAVADGFSDCALTVRQSDRQVERQAGGLRSGLRGPGAGRLNQGSGVHQGFVGVHAGEETHVPVPVRLQRHHGLLQLLGVGTTGLLKVCCAQDRQFH